VGMVVLLVILYCGAKIMQLKRKYNSDLRFCRFFILEKALLENPNLIWGSLFDKKYQKRFCGYDNRITTFAPS
jgi:hypothetical protein